MIRWDGVEQHESALAPGFRLDRYELLCPIARGGMAEVWLARQTGKHGFEKMVAIKTILPKFADDEGFQSMFLDEANVASRIEHPNVARVFDVGEQDDITYLVMEYVEGDALSTLHREARSHGVGIPHGVLLRLMAEVCGGLHAAHELRLPDGRHAGVVHRDVSPHNILVTTKGAAKLIDFGLAKALGRLSQETSAGIVKGKLRYMAPEQIVGPAVDRRADVWAVGASLYHLLSGEPPYEAEADADVLRALMSGRPPRPLGNAVHPAVEAVVLRSLAWQADQRFVTAHDFQRALEQAAYHAGIGASSADVAYFLAEHLGDRAEQRQEAISRGLSAAAERTGIAGRERTSQDLALLSARPSGPDVRPRDPWTGTPVPAPPSSGTRGTVTKNIVEPEPAPRHGSRALAGALSLAAVVLAGLGLAFRPTHLTSDVPVTPATALAPRTVRAATAFPARGASAPPTIVPVPPPSSAGPAAEGSPLIMTVSVMDLPVAAPTARSRVVAPVVRPQPPRPPLTAASGASAAQRAEDAASDESGDDASQGK
jgi:eukaryotic-like serine/threonine-protein kinase